MRLGKKRKRQTCKFFGSEFGHIVVLGVVPEHPEGVAQVLILDFAVAAHVEEVKRLRGLGLLVCFIAILCLASLEFHANL